MTVAGRYVGQSVRRQEDPRLLTGHGRYVDDIVVPGMLHAAFVRSSVPHGLLRGVDTEAARALPGVAAVLTAAELHPGLHPMWQTMMGQDAPAAPFRPLADADVRYVGDPIALVVVESRYIAEDAAELVVADIEPLPPVLDTSAALGDTASLVHPELGSNLAGELPAAGSPELDAAFASAALVATETFHQHRYACVPMETRGLVAQWDPAGEQLTVWAATQGPHEFRAICGRVLGLPEPRIRVIMGDVGGGFGQKMFPMREEIAVVAATRQLGRPVKWIEDRNENLLGGGHAREEQMTVSVAADDAGHFTGVRVEQLENVGAYPFPGNGSTAMAGSMIFPGPYRIPALSYAARAVYTTTCGRCAYRGPWMMETVAREQMVDLLARRLGMDPLELRRRNVITAEDLPFTTASGMVYETVSPAQTLEQAAELIGYDAFRREQAAERERGRLLGIGLALYIEPSQSFGPLGTDGATVRLEPDGRVALVMGTASHGQSLEMTMAQVVAEHLGCDLGDITFVQGDTAYVPYGAGTGGSRSAVVAAGAARQAALALRERIVTLAAAVLEAAPSDLEVASSAVGVRGDPASALPFAKLAGLAYFGHAALPEGAPVALEVTERFKAPPFTFSNACHAATVEVDATTGQVSILRYVVSEDCGVMINPMVVEGQIAGGVLQGIGGVLYEHMVYDGDGNPLTTTFLDYLLPTAAEAPAIEYGHVETASRLPGGAKGMGEGGAIASPPALANAINDALAPLGIHLTRQPMSPAAIVAALTP
ncbi:MAG: xanthine dehydrogenase family protein [Streptosporangiaceae bacterium]|nr:xanthine dehydrogenase family protein [Streptosporangiaceae bacterium]